MSWFLPLKRLFPLVLFAVGASLIGVNYTFQLTEDQQQARSNALSGMNTQGTRLAGMAEYLLAKNEIDGLQISLGLTALQADLDMAAIIDESNRLLLSSRNRWRGELIADSPFASEIDLVDAARREGRPRTIESDDQLVGAYPFHLPLEKGQIAQPSRGIVLLRVDLGPVQAEARSEARKHAGKAGLVLLLACLGLWYASRLLFTERIDQMLATANAFAAGNLDARTGVKSGDELGRLAAAIDSAGHALRQRETTLRENEDLRRVQEQLQRSERRFSGILQIAADAIISIDGGHRIRLFNQRAEEIFGFAESEVLGQPIDILLPERFRIAHRGHIEGFADSPVSARKMGERGQVFGRRKSGEEFPAEASISRLAVGEERTIIAVVRDISERVAGERALQESEERLAAANEKRELRIAERTRQLQQEIDGRAQVQEALSRAQRLEAIGQLAGGIAHDFNNLLTVISGNLELLQMRLKDQRNLTLANRASDAAEMGARLTSRLLTFAKRGQTESAPLNLNDQIVGMADLLRRTLGEAINLSTELEPAVWTVRADASEIENAILNLAINARDAMPEGGRLTLATANETIDTARLVGEKELAAGDYVRMSVADSGAGMTPEVLAQAFEPFFTTKQPGKGTGLGLSTVYGFVQQLGGTVAIHSEVDHGTAVHIYLPKATPGPQDIPAPIDRDTILVSAGECVLLVEDDEAVRELAVSGLEELGYKVLQADSARSAIEILSSTAGIDIVLSDVVMPGGMSGFDLLRWVRRNAAGIRVLLASGYPDVASGRDDSMSNVRILRKPYSRAELARRLRETLDHA